MAKKEKDLEEVKPVVSSDDAMEEPKTKDYNPKKEEEVRPVQPPANKKNEVYIQIKEEFNEDLKKTIGELGYNREIGSPEMHVQVFQIFDVLDKTKGKYLTEDQANQLISMVARAPYNVIVDVMRDITENQSKYFKVVSRAQIEEEAMKAAQKAKETPEAEKEAEPEAEEEKK